MQRERRCLQQDSPCDVLHKFVEIFDSKGWLNEKIKIKYQNKIYWISCNDEGFLAYRINENCGLGQGVPGWPVCMISKDYVYDESDISDITSVKLNMHDWLNIVDNQQFEWA